MATPSHGLVAWFCGTKLMRCPREMLKFLVLGSIAPDIVMLARGIAQFLNGRAIADIYRTIFTKDLTIVLHSFTIVLPLYVLTVLKSRPDRITLEKIKFFLAGILFFHIVPDFLTHDNFGHPHFWPLSDYVFKGITSDQNIYFATFDSLLSLAAILLFCVSLFRSPQPE